MINSDVKKYIQQSVLCWLGTVNKQGEPNVSPKEMFTYQDENRFLIANIASPNSVENIRQNPAVCVSFIDIFVQKGYQLKGTARLIEKYDPAFGATAKLLGSLFSDEYPIKSIIEITVLEVRNIQAPSYFLHPERSEQFQIASAMSRYQVKPTDHS